MTVSLPIEEYEALKAKLRSAETSLKNVRAENTVLREELRLAKRLQFAHKSEKWTQEDKAQQLIFNEAETGAESSVVESEVEPRTEVKGHSRKKKKKASIPDNLPVEEIIHDIDESRKICACGEKLSEIQPDRRRELDLIPAKLVVKEHVYRQYACKSCEGTADESKPGVLSATRNHIIPGSFASPGLLAYILVSKFDDHLPFYRLERIFKRLSVELSRTTMCNWAVQVGRKLSRMLVLMRKDLLSSDFVSAGETTLQVLDEKGRPARAKSYMWLFKSGPPDRPLLIYRYDPRRSTDVLRNNLRRYNGTLLSDGHEPYAIFARENGIIHAGCWAHARRKFKEAYDAGGSGHAESILKIIGRVYHYERVMQEENATAEEILHFRRLKSARLFKFLFRKLVKLEAEITPSSPLGKAIQYALGERQKLEVYLSRPHIPIDNNAVERAIRPFVVGRKNWLFSGNEKGASASAAIYSVLQTAHANGLDTYWYFRYLLEKLSYPQSRADLEALLPHRIDPSIISEFQKAQN